MVDLKCTGIVRPESILSDLFPWAHHLSRSNWPITTPGSSVSTAPSLECQCIFSSNPPFREEIQLCDSYKSYSNCYENNVFGAKGCFGTVILNDIYKHLKFVITVILRIRYIAVQKEAFLVLFLFLTYTLQHSKILSFIARVRSYGQKEIFGFKSLL